MTTQTAPKPAPTMPAPEALQRLAYLEAENESLKAGIRELAAILRAQRGHP